jgi:hypothetical protein
VSSDDDSPPKYGDEGLMALGIVGALLPVIANGFFVATEFAITCIRPTQVGELETAGTPGARATRSRSSRRIPRNVPGWNHRLDDRSRLRWQARLRAAPAHRRRHLLPGGLRLRLQRRHGRPGATSSSCLADYSSRARPLSSTATAPRCSPPTRRASPSCALRKPRPSDQRNHRYAAHAEHAGE